MGCLTMFVVIFLTKVFFFAACVVTLTSTTCSLLFQRNAIWPHLPHFILSNQFLFQKTTAFLDFPILVTQKSAVQADQSAQILMSNSRCLRLMWLLLHEWMLCMRPKFFPFCFICNCSIDSLHPQVFIVSGSCFMFVKYIMIDSSTWKLRTGNSFHQALFVCKFLSSGVVLKTSVSYFLFKIFTLDAIKS